jgi:hypothetical protein
MIPISRSMLICACLLLPATALLAQNEGKFGINLRVTGTTQLGVTWRVSPGLALRPAIAFDWIKTTTPFGDNETSIYGADLDLLFSGPTRDRVTTYYGVGGGVLYFNPGSEPVATAWLARALLGARVRIVERVALFGEVGLEYRAGDNPIGDEFSTATFPLGIVVFLK